jgi:hypothetical protein
MDPLDLTDNWIFLTIMGAALVFVAVVVWAWSPSKNYQRNFCRLASLLICGLFASGVIWVWRAHNHIRNAAELQNVKSIAIVTLAADTELVIGGGDDAKEEVNPREAAGLAYIQLKDTLEAFNKSAITVLPIANLKATNCYNGLSFGNQGIRKAGLRHLNLISADSSMQVLPVTDPSIYQRIIPPLQVDAALVIQVRFELNSDWRGKIPILAMFADPYWYGKTRVNAWLFAKDGSLIWRFHEDVKSKARERSDGYDFIAVRGSSITVEQSTKLLMNSIGESASRLSLVLEQDISKAKDQ